MATVLTELARHFDAICTGESHHILLEDLDPKFVDFLKNEYGVSTDSPTQPYNYLPERIFSKTQEKMQPEENRGLRPTAPTKNRNIPEAGVKDSNTVLDEPSKKRANRLWENIDNISGAKNIDVLRLRIIDCMRCGLCEQRTRIVFGAGNIQTEVLFVGEGPGQEEDRQGLPFVGKSGQLLTQMISAIGLNREGVYISNVVKCRPPQNRNPNPAEIAACLPILHRQIALLKPKLIVLLGGVALKALFGNDVSGITASRGRMMSYQDIPLLPTFHPSYLLRNPKALYNSWDDFRQIRQFLHTSKQSDG